MFTNLRWLTASALILTCPVLLACCHSIPLGNPETSASTADLTGGWYLEKGENEALVGDIVWMVWRYDPRTYLIQAFPVETDAETGNLRVLASRSTPAVCFKAWTTTVEDVSLITLQIFGVPLTPSDREDSEPVDYFTAKFTRTGDQLLIEALSAGFEPLRQARSSGELEAAIRQHIGDDNLFADSLTLRAMPREVIEPLFE